MTKLVDIEGIGPAYEAKFKTAGVTTVEDLLEQGATPQARKALAEKSGVAEQLVLRWVNHADLFRIKGVAGQYAELLEAAGVDSVVELSKRNAENLAKALEKANAERKRVDAVPNAAQVKKWIDEAKGLPRKVSY
jgi:predicted flap endonuclease-1-like 5' DNA nuclease